MGSQNVLVVFHLLDILIKIYLACRVKVGLKNIFTIQFQPYFLPTFIKSLQIVYSTSYKPNGGINVFKMKNKKLSNLLFCFLQKFVIFSNGILGEHIFSSNLPCLDPLGYHLLFYLRLLQVIISQAIIGYTFE